MFKKIRRIVSGEVDLMGLRTLNRIFGSKVLFVESPISKLSFIETRIEIGLRRIYIISPENFNNENRDKVEFEKVLVHICKLAMKKGIEIIPHLHLDETHSKNVNWIPDKKSIKQIMTTKKFFEKVTGKPIKKFSFGFWRFSHKNKNIEKLMMENEMTLARREPHIYDWWF